MAAICFLRWVPGRCGVSLQYVVRRPVCPSIALAGSVIEQQRQCTGGEPGQHTSLHCQERARRRAGGVHDWFGGGTDVGERIAVYYGDAALLGGGQYRRHRCLCGQPGSNNISGFSIASGGSLTVLSGSPYQSRTAVTALAVDGSGDYLLAAANGGSPDLTMYSYHSATAGKLDFATSCLTGTDPTGPVALAMTH